jgi:microcystin-dependent protein
MSLLTNNDFYLYAGRLFNQNDWDSNFKKIVTVLSAGTYDIKVNNATIQGAATVTGSVTANSFVGSGAGLTNITGNPIGSVMAYVGTTDPSSYLICDGRSILRAGTYASLYTVIGDSFGTIDGTHFNIPDLRGSFIRGLTMVDTTINNAVNTTSDTMTTPTNNTLRTGMEIRFTTTTSLPVGLSAGVTYYARITDNITFSAYDTRAHAIAGGATGLIDLTGDGAGTNKVISWVDPDASSRLAPNVGGATGVAIGSWQDSQYKSHTHDTTLTGTGGTGGGAVGLDGNLTLPFGQSATYTSATSGGNETRPQNNYMNYIIRYQ